jgi:hypothetical protein
MTPRLSMRERFFSKTRRDDVTGCLLWIASTHPTGYGRFSMGHSRWERAHRVAWQLAHGAIPAGQCVLHKCDNPSCVEVEHLFLGTQPENLIDMTVKGRRVRGAKVGSARLTECQVHEARCRYERGDISKAELARSLKVHRITMHDLLVGKTWKASDATREFDE